MSSSSFLLTSLTLLLFACGDKETDPDEIDENEVEEEERQEGTEAGDCTDGADNDGDGDFDCDDDGCEGSPDCEEDTDVDDPDDIDDDGDGLSENEGDCDDSDADINPDAEDNTVDGIDQNCDGTDGIDEDEDGFASVDSGGTDCDDSDASTNPDAEDTIDEDGIDQNCDGADGVDEDGDSFASVGSGGADCDDSDAAINPGATDTWYDGIDSDCSGGSDYDQDGDGQDSDLHSGTDCNDEDGTIYLGATEILGDGIDQDCDGSDQAADNDGDGFDNTVDCDDNDNTVYPGATEICDGLLNDCDASSIPADETDDDGDGYVECAIDANGWDGDPAVLGGEDCDDGEAAYNPGVIWYADSDGDGFGDANSANDCEPLNSTDVTDNTDCDISDGSIYPSAPELCDGIDNDCDGSLPTTETDDDGDGYIECIIHGSGWQGDPAVIGGQDCEDGNALISPSATELCDGIDNDCDLLIPAEEQDLDGDGFIECEIDASGWQGSTILGDGDCGPNDSTVHPGAAEICDGQDNNCDSIFPFDETDDDADGYVECAIDANGWDGDPAVLGGEDCDDGDGSFYPGLFFYADADGDGFGDANSANDCEPLNSTDVTDNTDCNDNSALSYVGATEICDGLDNDCDSNIPADEADDDGDGYAECIVDANGWSGDPSIVGGEDCNDSDPAENPSIIYYADADGDGYGDSEAGNACEPLNSTDVTDGSDCDDTDPAINAVDIDGDGFSGCFNDCWDSALDADGDGVPDSAAVYPGAATQEPRLCTVDADGDGYGDAFFSEAFEMGTCFQLGLVDTGSYWDNAEISVYVDGVLEGAYTNTEDSASDEIEGFEICPSGTVTLSYDCTSSYDCGAHTWYVTFDENENGDYSDDVALYSDGYNITGLAPTNGVEYTLPYSSTPIDQGSDCDDADASTIGDDDGDGFTYCTDDCDDTDPTIRPDAIDVCDGVDQNCSGDESDVSGSLTFYADADGDGFGDPAGIALLCEGSSDFATNDLDCDDSNADINPNALEVCDLIDNDCDLDIDQADSSFDSSTLHEYYLDIDGDGYGEEGSTMVQACEPPIEQSTGNPYATNDDDCDDGHVSVYLDAPELCDGIDNDCDGVIDDKPSDAMQYYLDVDGDGYGDDSTMVIECSDPSTPTETYVTVGGDCDDSDPSFNPAAVDTCDGLDQNCSGDESDVSGNNVFYIDLDGDGYGNPVASILACQAPANFVTDDTDCDDGDPAVNTASTEVCDGVDNDCNGDVDLDDVNLDASTLITFYYDADGDGFGDASNTTQDCSAPSEYVEDASDCDDDANDADGDGIADGAVINPDAEETYYDGVDGNCDGLSDYDADEDGDDSTEYAGSCSDTQYTNQTDCEDNAGVWTATGTDCDDTNPASTGSDLDGDGVSSCAGDCNDSADDEDGDGVADGFYTYPGAAYNEQNSGDCLTDMDGDGWAGQGTFGCFDFSTFDSYGDGWNGNSLEIYEDGVFTASITNQNLDGVSYNSGNGEYNYLQHCFDGDTESIEIYFTDGSYNSEVSFEMFDSTGLLLGTGEGSGSADLIFDGVTYTDGDLIYSASVPMGNDCDDEDASIGMTDSDGDGSTDCLSDCDPSDPALNDNDDDGDGFSTCDGDCDDNDATIYPGAADTWYDGIDSDCAGDDDYDQDGDGDLDISNGGTDCDDTDPAINGSATEICDGVDNDCDGDIDDADSGMLQIDMNEYYEDLDGDGYGNDSVVDYACSVPANFSDVGGDCNDDPNNGGTDQTPDTVETYYDGIDGNCDGLSDFDADEDGDDSPEYAGSCSDTQYTNQTDCEAVSEVWTPTGTDCDDADSASSGIDMDGDGISSCDGDCDDSADDADGDGLPDGMFTYPGAAFNEPNSGDCLTDYDGDGYSGQGSFGCYDFNTFDSYGDGWNGNAIEIYEDGVLTGTIENQNLDGVMNYSSGGEYNYIQHCFASSTVDVELVFVDGSYNTEVEVEIFDNSGTSIGFGEGSGTTDLIFDGVTYVDGDVIYSATVPVGNDCDDTDPNVTNQDNDGDGYSACTNDCDDNDPLNAPGLAEDCTDGQDNDCDGLADCDDSDCAASCFELDCEDGLDGDGDGDIDCDDSDCAGELACMELICDDGIDDDGDGDIDCADADCAGDFACFEDCTDGIDNDLDGDVDCDDADCAGDIDCDFACLDLSANDLGDFTGAGIATGTNAGEGDDTEGSCATASGGEDVSYIWTAPAAGTYSFSTAGSDYDTILYVSESCVSVDLDCNDDVDFAGGDSSSEIVDLYVFDGEELIITIDSFDDFESGTYSLDIHPTFEQSCDDGTDDDGDGVTDCADSDCSFDPACATLACPNYDLGTSTGSVMYASLDGATTDHFDASCTTTSNNDFVIAWEANDTGCATFETTGSLDTILAIFDDCPDAGGTELSCNDDGGVGNSSLINLDVTAGSSYYIGVDSYSSSFVNSYGLDITIEPNVSCN